MPAPEFLDRLYQVPGIKSTFDAVALHPYAADAKTLERYTEEIRGVILANRDPRAQLWITELGWGSQGNSPVSFERGWKGQARELRLAYRYLLDSARRLNLMRTYWFSWKDAQPAPCTFCDSVGLFRAGSAFKPKPSWFSFVRLAGGRVRPATPAPPEDPPPPDPPPTPSCPLILICP